jgi:glycosyltransferase involved in cell wall biosynthesis
LNCPTNIAIVDHVGSKAGIDYYSLELLQGLYYLNCDCYYFSNEAATSHKNIQTIKVFERFTPKGKIHKARDYFFGHLTAFRRCRNLGINNVILHSFAFGIKELVSVLMCKIFGFKITLIVHDISALAGKDKNWIRNLNINSASHLVVHNQYSYLELKKLLSNLNKKKLVIIEHGNFINLIDPKVSRNMSRASLGLDDTKKYILFFGQIKKVKGLDTLLRALALTSDNIHLIIAGKPWQVNFEEYQELIFRLNLQNRIKLDIRHIEEEQREVLFKASDAIVLPYKKIYQSGVLLMAMSYSIPTIVSNLPPFEEVITDGKNGLIFGVNNEKSLADKINELFNDEEKQEMISRMSYHTVQTKYSWTDIAIKYCKLLSK